jgi:hypothetical protein
MIYRVGWEIDIEAESPREAAEKVRQIQQDRESIAHIYHVTEYANDGDAIAVGASSVIDLDDYDDDEDRTEDSYIEPRDE